MNDILYEKPNEIIFSKDNFFNRLYYDLNNFDTICVIFKLSETRFINAKRHIKPILLIFKHNKQDIHREFIDKYYHLFNNSLPIIKFENERITKEPIENLTYNRVYLNKTSFISFYPYTVNTFEIDNYLNKSYLANYSLPELLTNEQTISLFKSISLYDLLQQAYNNQESYNFKYNTFQEKFNILTHKLSLHHLLKNIDFSEFTNLEQ